VRFVPLLAALTDNPALLVVGFMIVVSIIQQVAAGKKAFDKTVARQRADLDAVAGSTGTPPPTPPTPQPAQPQNAALARALLVAEIDAMANARGRSAAQPSAVAQQPPPQQPIAQPSAVRAAPQQAAARQRHTPRQRPAAWQDPGFGGGTAAVQAADRSFATLPTRLDMDATPSGLLTATSGLRAPSSTRRMLTAAFRDPAHARNAVILAEVLGTPLGLR
jgi:hypothetical protein